MFKLLLVSDRDEVLSAFDNVTNWEFNGFRKPHVRHDVEGAKESLRKHHADGIIIALPEEEDARLVDFLQEEYPVLPIVEAGTTPEEVNAHLDELSRLLSHVNADFSSDQSDLTGMMIHARRRFFRKIAGGEKITREEMRQKLRLLRSRMDPDQPCALMRLEKLADDEEHLVGSWRDSDHLLERTLFQSFGGDVNGFHVLPLVLRDGRIYVLAVPLRGQETETTVEEMEKIIEKCVRNGLQHVEEYQGLYLKILEAKALPNMYAFCEG